MVTILDAREQLKDPNAMDVGVAEEESRIPEVDFDLAAVGMVTYCHRGGGMERVASEGKKRFLGKG